MTTTETGLDLEPIDNALILATPGPWVDGGQLGYARWIIADGYKAGDGRQIATTYGPTVNPCAEANAHLIANAPTWLRQMHDEIVRLRGRLALARGEVEGVADEAASFQVIPPTDDDIASLCAGLQIAKRALTE